MLVLNLSSSVDRTPSPNACQYPIAGSPNMHGISQFHTGQNAVLLNEQLRLSNLLGRNAAERCVVTVAHILTNGAGDKIFYVLLIVHIIL